MSRHPPISPLFPSPTLSRSLLFTAFGSRFFPRNLNEPIASLTVQIYNYAISPYDEWHAQAWPATLVQLRSYRFGPSAKRSAHIGRAHLSTPVTRSSRMPSSP